MCVSQHRRVFAIVDTPHRNPMASPELMAASRVLPTDQVREFVDLLLVGRNTEAAACVDRMLMDADRP